MKRVVFDIDTEPFSQVFQNAKTIEERAKHAPSVHVVCLYNEQTGHYSYFWPRDFHKLISQLKSAEEVISFGGKRFDLPVLKHYDATLMKIPEKGAHIDMCEIVAKYLGLYASLDKAVHTYLGERKCVEGRNVKNFEPYQLKQACRSDVRQTYELWKLYKEGHLTYPSTFRRLRRGHLRKYAK